MADGGHGLVLMMMMTKPCSRSGVGFQEEKGIAVCGLVAANDWISNRWFWKMLTMEDICYLEHHGGELVVVQDKRLQLECRR